MPCLTSRPCGLYMKDVRSCGPPYSGLQATPLMMHWRRFQANDLLTQGILLYKQVMEGRVSAGNAVPPTVGTIPAPRVFPNPEPCGKNWPLIDLEAPSLLYQDLAALGINDVPTRNQIVIPSCYKDKTKPGAITLLGGGIQSLSADRNLLDFFSLQPSPGITFHKKASPRRWHQLPSPLQIGPGRLGQPLASSTASQNTPLTHVFVPLESVKPSSLSPIIVYDPNGFRILLHFSQTEAPGHPNVQVLLWTMISTATQPVWDVMFQLAVPKSMRVKLQPASSSKLPAFSPLMPPAVIAQVLLLDNPHKEPI